MPSTVPLEGNSLTILTSHYALLEDAISTQLGPLAGRVVRKLGERGALTLKEIAQSLLNEPFQSGTTVLEAARAVGSSLAVGAEPVKGSMEPSVLIDAAIKEVMTRLVLHRVVAPSGHQATYELRLGYGLLLHAFHPLIAQAARRRHGEAGEALVLVVRQLAVVPLDSAVKLVSGRCPSLPIAQVRAAALGLEAAGWLEDMDAERRRAMGENVTVSGHKRPRDTSSSSSSPLAECVGTYPCRLCVPVVLQALLRDALEQWVVEHFPDDGLSASLVAALLDTMQEPADESLTANSIVVTGEGTSVTNAFGFPPVALATHSQPMTPTMLRAVLAEGGGPFADASREDVQAALRLLAQPTSGNGGPEGPIVRRTNIGSSGGLEHYALHLPAVVSALQLACCERTVFSRHGVLGVRVVKLLLRHRLLEDRTLAEEAVATQSRTRQTLHAMLRDGYVYQQEVPRSAVTGDRQPKNSIFLWGCGLRQSLLPVVREQLANAQLHATTKLREVVAQANAADAADSASTSHDHNNGISGSNNDSSNNGTAAAVLEMAKGTLPPASQEAVRKVLRLQRNVVGLQSSAMSLLRMTLIMDYY